MNSCSFSSDNAGIRLNRGFGVDQDQTRHDSCLKSQRFRRNRNRNKVPGLAVGVVLVVVLPAAVALRQHHHQEDSAETSDAAPEAEDTADDGFHLEPELLVLGGAGALVGGHGRGGWGAERPAWCRSK